MLWSHTDPVTGSHGLSEDGGYYWSDQEFNADGIDVGTDPPDTGPADPDTEFVKLSRSSGCGMLDIGCTSCSFGGASMSCTEVAHIQEFFGFNWYELPGNNDGPAQGERRYLQILNGEKPGRGLDPAFGRYWGTFRAPDGRILKNPTADEWARAETSYGSDTGFSDENTHDITTPSKVWILGGPEYLVPQNSSTDRAAIMAFQTAFYRAYSKALNDCIKTVFKGDSAKVAEQTLSNAPSLVANLNFEQTAHIGYSRGAIFLGLAPNEAYGHNDPRLGANGTVHIASEVWTSNGSNATNAVVGTYAHELANVLDERLNPRGVPPRHFGFTYGNPNDPIDADTGAAVERCMFNGKLQGVDGPYPQ